MKFLVLFVFLLPTLAWSFPSVGDYVLYQADYEGSPISMEKSVLAHDESSDVFTVHILMSYKGNVFSEKYVEQPRFFLYDEAKVQNVLNTCESREGAISYVRVSEQNITACEFYHEDSGLTYMIGMVPFGQVRFLEYLGDGVFLDFNLKAFR